MLGRELLALLAGLLALGVSGACRGSATGNQGGGAASNARPPSAPSAPPASAVHDAAVTRPAPPPAPVAHPEIDLRWLPDGRRVLVDGRLLLDEHGQYAALAWQLGAPEPPGAATRRPIFSPDGKRALVLVGTKLRVGDPTTATRPQVIPLPRWLLGSGARHEPANPLLFWLEPQLIFAQGTEPDGRESPPCGSYDLRARRWNRARRGCLSAGFNSITEVDLGPDGLLALHSSSEGHAAIDIVRYRGDGDGGGQVETGTPPLVLEGSSLIRARFAADGSRVWLLSPCVLEGARPPPCEDFNRQPAWRLYQRPIGAGPLRLMRADLPAGTALHPAEDRFAWTHGRSVCLGDPREGAPACHPLPPTDGGAGDPVPPM